MPEVPRSLFGARHSTMTEEERTAHDARLRAVVNQNSRDSLRHEPRGGATHQGFMRRTASVGCEELPRGTRGAK